MSNHPMAPVRGGRTPFPLRISLSGLGLAGAVPKDDLGHALDGDLTLRRTADGWLEPGSGSMLLADGSDRRPDLVLGMECRYVGSGVDGQSLGLILHKDADNWTKIEYVLADAAQDYFVLRFTKKEAGSESVFDQLGMSGLSRNGGGVEVEVASRDNSKIYSLFVAIANGTSFGAGDRNRGGQGLGTAKIGIVRGGTYSATDGFQIRRVAAL